MKEKPILFSGPMIKAILEGRKTMTRRVVSGLPEGIRSASALPESGYKWRFSDFDRTVIDLRCPYGRPPIPLEPADRLWVRETWAAGLCADAFKPRELDSKTWLQDNGGLWYAASGSQPKSPISDRGKWRPGRFMVRWASRLTLEITKVRVERLQDISEEDALEEGMTDCSRCGGFGQIEQGGDAVSCPTCKEATVSHAREYFSEGWDSLNGKRGYGWATNPWCWVIEFRRTDGIQQS